MPISDTFSIQLYADTRPHHQSTLKLQKGLILTSRGIELSGEGVGLGVPALRYNGNTYFSGSSTVEFEKTSGHVRAVKKFTLDLASERTLRNISVETKTIQEIKRSFDNLYMKHKRSRLLPVEKLLNQIGIQRDFVRTKPVAVATVTYTISRSHVRVGAEFKLHQKKGFQRIYLLNEQGSAHFRKYYDSSGMLLYDKAIGAWEAVNAEWACIHSVEEKVGFRLWKREKSTLYRGREFLSGLLDWVGLDYEVDPGTIGFGFDIELVRS